MSEDRMEKGRAVRRELMGDRLADNMASTTYTNPLMQKFGDYAVDAVFAGLWTRPGLDLKTRALICCVSDTAIGAWPELKIHLRMARRQGWTEDELTEALLHMSGYVGLPRVREAFVIACETFDELAKEDDG